MLDTSECVAELRPNPNPNPHPNLNPNPNYTTGGAIPLHAGHLGVRGRAAALP